MKLFIWNDPYRVYYGSSLLIAVAETEDEARQTISNNATFNSYGTPDRHPIGYPAELVAKLGPPLRIVEAPCAEFHQWGE